jgi:beta-galactosidase
VHLAPGRNELLASAEIAGEQLTDRVQWTYNGTPGIVRIKAGDLAGYTTAAGARFGSDLYFSGGHGAGINAPDTPEAKRIAVHAGEAGLYTTYREGTFQYRIRLPPGRYRLLLHFTEPTATASGERLFDVDVDDGTPLQRFDIFAAAGGKLIGVQTALEVTVSDEELRLAFRPEKGQALVSALELTPLERSR